MIENYLDFCIGCQLHFPVRQFFLQASHNFLLFPQLYVYNFFHFLCFFQLSCQGDDFFIMSPLLVMQFCFNLVKILRFFFYLVPQEDNFFICFIKILYLLLNFMIFFCQYTYLFQTTISFASRFNLAFTSMSFSSSLPFMFLVPSPISFDS